MSIVRGRRKAAMLVAAVTASGAFAASAAQAAPVVKTGDGSVRGVTRTNYDAYLGIPFAAPPTGENRFKAPQPVEKWSGVRDATKFGSRCVQGTGWDPGYEALNLNEDCLYLNVYVPHPRPFASDEHRGKRPVFVWIHGGGFQGGAGQDTDPRKYVTQSDAVFVTVNYRLSTLGFLNLPQLREEGAGAGVFGLLDQQAALRWVQRNISRFGGNRNNVTIAGQSAGGSAVCDQLVSPTARGLFDKAVIQSGGCAMATQAAADRSGQAFVNAVGCGDAADVLACLRGKTPAEIFDAQRAAGNQRPSVGDASFPLDPAQAVASGKFSRVPVISGQVDNERSLFTFQNNDYLGKPITAESYEAMVRSTYGANADKVLAEYPVANYASPGEAWTQAQDDSTSFTRLQFERNLARWTDTYVYEFDESQTPQFRSIFLLQQQNDVARSFPFGATHVDELGYLWEYLGGTMPYTDDELELSDQMIGYWSAFQYKGTPNGPYLPKWPEFGRTHQFMSLDACETAESSTTPPAACSKAMDVAALEADHNLDFWQSVLG